MPIGFIGDVHAKFDRYDTMLKRAPYPTVQIGDMGVGFVRPDGGSYPNPPHGRMIKGGHRFIRGNHDNPSTCRKHSQWIPDGHIETTPKGHKIMYIGGAWSTDRDQRTEGIDWWTDEELSYSQLRSMIELFDQEKPDIMITHEAPEEVAFRFFLKGTSKAVIRTRTGQALEHMRASGHTPKLWAFAHWHEHRDAVIDGTRFVCLAELQQMEFDL